MRQKKVLGLTARENEPRRGESIGPGSRAGIALFFFLFLTFVALSYGIAETGGLESGVTESGGFSFQIESDLDSVRAREGDQEGSDDEDVEIVIVVEGDGEGFEGRTIANYELRCDLTLCQSPQAVERFKEISGLARWQSFEEARLIRAQRRLAKTGFFSELMVERRLEEDGVHILIEAKGATLIRRVRFEGLRPPPFETELRKVLMFRSGQVFRNNPDEIDAQMSSLESLFEREGYFGSTVTLEVVPIDGEPHLVDLIFQIERGNDRRICALGFRGVRAMTTAEARELMLSGVSVIGRRIPLFLPLFTTENFRIGRDALIQEYRRRGYYRARIVDQAVQIDSRTNCVQLLVDVNEGPFWSLTFEGNQSISEQALRAQMPFAASGYVDPDEIRRAENILRQLYEAAGYPFASVTGREEAADRLDRSLLFEIEEGPRIQIDRVVFHGLRAFTEREARSGFGTQPFGLFDSGGYLQTEQLLADITRLEQRYREAGYLLARVESFALELNDRGDAMTVRLFVNEGPRTMVRALQLRGYEVLDRFQIERMLRVGQGDPFQAVGLRADQSRLVQLYGAAGYPRAQVEVICSNEAGVAVPCQAPRLAPQCIRNSFDALTAEQACEWRESATPVLLCRRVVDDDENCTPENGIIGPVVDISYQLREGPRVRVGEILLKGNFRTRSAVIYRELTLQTGEVLDLQRLYEGQGNMRSLGIFDSVSIETIGLDEEEGVGEDNVASLIISVEESRSRFLDFRFGLEGQELLGESRRLLFTGETQYTNNNLLGTGQRFRPRMIGALNALDLLRIGDPGVEGESQQRGIDYLFGAELIYNHPRFLKGQTGVDKLFLTITPFYLIDLIGVTTERVLREEWGLRLQLRKELSEILERFFVTFGIEAKQAATWTANDLRIDGERIFSPRRATAKFIPEFTLDRRDSPLNPRQGYYLQFKPELVSGDAFSQAGEELIGDSYWRFSAALSYFWRFWESFTFGQGLQVGQITPLFDRQTVVPVDERFYLGGVGSLRGFPTNSLGPIGERQQPTGGEFLLNYNAELRYPLIREWSLYGATFFDAGILVDCFDPEEGNRSTRQCYRNAFPEEARLSQVRATAGIGLRFLILDQIPLLFDYGVVLNRRAGEGFGSFHFNLGYTF